jgi:hypothetical protein
VDASDGDIVAIPRRSFCGIIISFGSGWPVLTLEDSFTNQL